MTISQEAARAAAKAINAEMATWPYIDGHDSTIETVAKFRSSRVVALKAIQRGDDTIWLPIFDGPLTPMAFLVKAFKAQLCLVESFDEAALAAPVAPEGGML